MNLDNEVEAQRLRSCYVAELQLANRILAASPGEIVLHYGNPVEIQGADVVSIGPDRLITKWASGWRNVERSVRTSTAAMGSLDRALVEAVVWKAINANRLAVELGRYALRRFEEGHYNVCLVVSASDVVEFVRARGTGNA